MTIETIGFALLYCMVATVILCFFAYPICDRLDLLDTPNHRKVHREPVPLTGGLALGLAAMPAATAVAVLLTPAEWAGRLLIWSAAVTAMTIVGAADDRHTLSARDRLLASFLVFGSASALDAIYNVRLLSFSFPSFEIGLGTGWLAAIFTTLCCVGLVNAVNMADGKNGLVIGLCLGWLSILLFRVPPNLAPPVIILIATLLVLLPFNLRGKIFLGDGGAYGFATGIALIAIATYNIPGNHAGRAISAEELMLLFSVPVLDSFRLTWTRLRQKRSPMSPDRDHLHHHLERRFGWPTGLVIYLIAALAPSILLSACKA